VLFLQSFLILLADLAAISAHVTKLPLKVNGSSLSVQASPDDPVGGVVGNAVVVSVEVSVEVSDVGIDVG